MSHKLAIENSPLQAYASALLFSPARSLIRSLFRHEEPKWITIQPSMSDEWSACLQTFEGHSGEVGLVAFSHDSTLLALASNDKIVRIWNVSSSTCLQTLKGHSRKVNSITFSHDSMLLASASDDETVKIWNVSSSVCLQTLEGHSDWVNSIAFSHNSTLLASASDDNTVRIWDVSSSICLQTLEGHSDWVNSVAFSHDSTLLASASRDSTVMIWDASSSTCLQTLEGHSNGVNSVAFSHDSTLLASASGDRTIRIWDASNSTCLQTLEVGKALYTISFDATSSCLYTEIGTIAIAPSLPLTTTVIKPPKYQGGGLSSSGAWITYSSKNVVWLPSEYRPSCSAVSANTVAIGVGSGKVWMCSFDVESS
jgi:WD40 repeat protein